jgi:hypothetical protein
MNLSLPYEVDDLIPRYVQEAIEQQRRYQGIADADAAPVIKQLQSFQKQLADLQEIADRHQDLIESSKRWTDALTIAQTELPKRGWYLTGKEAGTLTERLASLARDGKWADIDQILVRQASALTVNTDAFSDWLKKNSVPDCCVKRVEIFLKARDQGDHEVATLVGVPLIDELCRSLYGGRDFTSKRSKQPKPQMACSSGNATARLNHYCEGFVDSFGLIHHDVDTSRVEDEDYFNRSAILHGMMRRSYSSKDSAKTFMTLMFVVFALEEGTGCEPESPAANADDVDSGADDA